MLITNYTYYQKLALDLLRDYISFDSSDLEEITLNRWYRYQHLAKLYFRFHRIYGSR